MNELIRELVEALEYSSDFLSRGAHQDLTALSETLAKARTTALKQEAGRELRMGCLLFWMATTTLKFGSLARRRRTNGCGLQRGLGIRRWNHPLALRRVHARGVSPKG